MRSRRSSRRTSHREGRLLVVVMTVQRHYQRQGGPRSLSFWRLSAGTQCVRVVPFFVVFGFCALAWFGTLRTSIEFVVRHQNVLAIALVIAILLVLVNYIMNCIADEWGFLTNAASDFVTAESTRRPVLHFAVALVGAWWWYSTAVFLLCLAVVSVRLYLPFAALNHELRQARDALNHELCQARDALDRAHNQVDQLQATVRELRAALLEHLPGAVDYAQLMHDTAVEYSQRNPNVPVHQFDLNRNIQAYYGGEAQRIRGLLNRLGGGGN